MLKGSAIVSSIRNVFPRLTHYPSLKQWPHRVEFRRRSKPRGHIQLHFTRIVPLDSPKWAWDLLLSMQRLIEKNQSAQALERCLNRMKKVKAHGVTKEAQQDFYERAVSLYTHSWHFIEAVELINYMLDEGMEIKAKICMSLMRGMASHDPRHIKQVRAMFTSGKIFMDDMAFKMILNSMVLLKESVQTLEQAFMIYKEFRGPAWLPPSEIFGILIKSFAQVGNFERALWWLEQYRSATAAGRLRHPAKHDPNAKFKAHRRPIRGEEDAINFKLNRRHGSLAENETDCFPYAAMLYGYSSVKTPLSREVTALLKMMRTDGVYPDVEMCNLLLTTFFKWGWHRRALAIYDSMLLPGRYPLPDAYTFRKMFIGLNYLVPYNEGIVKNLRDIRPRQLFREMLAVSALKAHRWSYSPKKRIISTDNYNVALNTFMARNDYAAAWVVVVFFVLHNIQPNSDTTKQVTLGLLQRIRHETWRLGIDDVVWTDRFLGVHRSDYLIAANRTMLADELYRVGREESARFCKEPHRQETFIVQNDTLTPNQTQDLKFLTLLLRRALRAEVYASSSENEGEVNDNLSLAFGEALKDLTPPGRRTPMRERLVLDDYRMVGSEFNYDPLGIDELELEREAYDRKRLARYMSQSDAFSKKKKALKNNIDSEIRLL